MKLTKTLGLYELRGFENEKFSEKKFLQGTAILTLSSILGCNPATDGKKKNDISNLIPIALTGGNSTYTEPNDGGQAVSTYNSTDTQIIVPNGTTVTAGCFPC